MGVREGMRRKLIVVTLALFFMIAPIVGAQSKQGQGLEISPPLSEIKANPGQTVVTKLKVRNVTSETLVVKAEVNDFTAAGEDGQPKLLLEEGEVSPYSIKDWITTISELTLAPKEQESVTIKMAVPNSASPGGHYGVVRFTGSPPGLEDSGVSLSASIGTLILVNISGDVTEQATIEEVYASQNGAKRSLFEYGPITLVERIKNTGNVHIKPSGTIRVTNMFNREVASYSFNEAGGNVLPDSIRKFEQKLDKKLLFGRFKIQADIVYGSDNKIISDSASFWVIPYKVIAMIIAGIILLIFFIRKYNKFIVRRSKGRSK